MKRTIFLCTLVLSSLFANAQMKASWFQAEGKGVCAAYNYGQFTGETGKRHKYVPKHGKRRVKGRSHRSMQYNARRVAQKRLHLFNPPRR